VGPCTRAINSQAAYGDPSPYPFERLFGLVAAYGIGINALRWESVRHPFSESFNARLRPRTFSPEGRGRHYRPADSPNAVVDYSSVLFDVIVTPQVKRLAHSANVPFRNERANDRLKARCFRH
jgi:hypothetical protein